MNQSEENSKFDSEHSFRAEIVEFEQTRSDIPVEASEKLSTMERKIRSELLLSRKRFFVTYVVASVAGYFFSLSLCSQNSIAITAFSLDTAALLHSLPDPWCPLVCGWFFSLLPVCCLFVFLDRFQVRRMLQDFWLLPAVTAFLSCALMIVLPSAFQHDGMHLAHSGIRHTQSDVVWLMWWTFAAISIPSCIGWIGRRRLSV